MSSTFIIIVVIGSIGGLICLCCCCPVYIRNLSTKRENRRNNRQRTERDRDRDTRGPEINSMERVISTVPIPDLKPGRISNLSLVINFFDDIYISDSIPDCNECDCDYDCSDCGDD